MALTPAWHASNWGSPVEFRQTNWEQGAYHGQARTHLSQWKRTSHAGARMRSSGGASKETSVDPTAHLKLPSVSSVKVSLSLMSCVLCLSVNQQWGLRIKRAFSLVAAPGNALYTCCMRHQHKLEKVSASDGRKPLPEHAPRVCHGQHGCMIRGIAIYCSLCKLNLAAASCSYVPMLQLVLALATYTGGCSAST